ncbi:MAG: hypothetical protein R2764_11745 [Bacteroidales bacterium]
MNLLTFEKQTLKYHSQIFIYLPETIVSILLSETKQKLTDFFRDVMPQCIPFLLVKVLTISGWELNAQNKTLFQDRPHGVVSRI